MNDLDPTVGDIFDTLSAEQQEACYYLVGCFLMPSYRESVMIQRAIDILSDLNADQKCAVEFVLEKASEEARYGKKALEGWCVLWLTMVALARLA